MDGNGKPTAQEATNIDAYMENMKLMNAIVAELKEIPVLPSEKPTDVNPLLKVEFPSEGGVLTYMEGYELPYRGFPFYEMVEKIDTIKKIGRATLSGMYHSLRRHWYLLPTLLPAIWVVGDLIYVFIHTAYRIVERFRMKPLRYSQAVREIYRAFSVPQGEDAKTQELRLMLRDVVCMILEFDNAYRFRAQDILEHLDKEALKKNTPKEMMRLLNLLQSREQTEEIRDTWSLLKHGVRLYLRFDRKLQRLIAGVLAEVDISKVTLTAEDKTFAEKRADYVFGFNGGAAAR